jgi:hypothetical protein
MATKYWTGITQLEIARMHVRNLVDYETAANIVRLSSKRVT